MQTVFWYTLIKAHKAIQEQVNVGGGNPNYRLATVLIG